MFYGLGTHAARMLVGATSTIYLRSSGLTLADLGLLKAVQAAIILCAGIPLGYIADKWGRSNMVRLSTALSVVWLVLTAVRGDKYLFFVAEIFDALAIALYSGAFYALLMDAYKRETGKDDYERVLGKYHKWQFGFMAGTSFIGSVLAPPTSCFIWWFAALLVFTQMVLFNWVLPKEERIQMPHHLTRSPLWSIGDNVRVIHKVIFSSFPATMLASAYILLTFCYHVLMQFWQPMIGGRQVANHPGAFYGGSFLLILAAEWFAAHCSEQKVSNYFLINCVIFMIIALAILALFGHIFPTFLVIGTICLVFFFLRLIMLTLYAAFLRLQPESMWATAESVLSALSRVLLLPMSPLLGRVSQQMGVMVIPTVLLVTSFLAFCPIVGIARIKRW
jgi:MFS family permease